MSTKKTTLKFCQIRNHINYLPWICAEVKNIAIFTIYLTYLKILLSFQPNWIRTYKFEIKLLDIAVTFKYSQGHWMVLTGKNWRSSTIMQSLTFITFMVSEKITMLKFSTSPDLTDQKHVNHLLIHTWATQIILYMIFLMRVATRKHLNYRG